MRLGWVIAGVLLPASAAPAADALRFGPAPAWVQAGIAAPASTAEQGAISLRLIDTQTRFDAAGSHAFIHQRLKINAPEGLQQAGGVTASWQPATDGVTVHAITIVRAGAAIDVLKDGKGFTTLRRENGLESAMIDGRLTAVLQVPDLRVGDELDYAMTIDQLNPVLAGHIQNAAVLAGGAKVGRVRIRQTWPAAHLVRWREGAALPRARLATRAGETELLFDQSDFTLPELPQSAPSRFVDIAKIEVGDFQDWPAVSALIAPLFEKAATLAAESPLKAEIARIAASSADPLARAGAALALVQSQVRYFADASGLGGLVPVPADRVWADRVGDCKGKTVLLLALLRGLGIAAQPALVSVGQGDGIDAALPMPGRFDHVIVRATIDGRAYWLDGTRIGDGDPRRIVVPPFRWALPLAPGGQALVALVPTPPTQAYAEFRLDLDARKGVMVPAAATGEARFRGDSAIATRRALLLIDPGAREAAIRKFWEERHDWVTVKSASYTLDDPTGDVVVRFTGDAPMNWNLKGADAAFRYEANKSQLGQDLDPKRKPGAASDAPVAVDEQYVVTHQTILLPDGGKGFFLQGGAIDETAGGVRYTRTASLAGGRFDMTATTRADRHEISIAEAKAADIASDRIFADHLYVRLPATYAMTAADREQVDSTTPADTSTAGRALALIARHDQAGALKTIEAAVAKGERNAKLLTIEAGLLSDLKRLPEANAAADAALALEPRGPEALYTKAVLLARAGRREDALLLIDRLILIQPENIQAYSARAEMRAASNDPAGSLADYGIIVAKQPGDVQARIGRVNLLFNMGKSAEAIAEARDFVKVVPEDEVAHGLLGNALARDGHADEARAELARSIALGPSADAYRSRFAYGLAGDDAARLADALAAIRLDPGRPLPTIGVRRLLADPASYQKLMTAYDLAIKAAPGDERIANARDLLAATAGHPEAALRRLDAAVAREPGNAGMRNEACWQRATSNVELPKALADCDAAVAADRNAADLDSRALVHLRMGDMAKAIADYDAALALNPRQGGSLYGRGLAKLRAGDRAAGQADLAAARAIRPEIAADFEGYGLKP